MTVERPGARRRPAPAAPIVVGRTLMNPLIFAALLAVGAADDKAAYRPDLFRTLVDPDCSHCRDEAARVGPALRDDDRVLAWVRGDYGGGAIPYRWFLVPHRVISDTYGVFVYDPDAGFARGWPAALDFRFHGWRNGVMVMRRADGTVFDCLTGRAVEGPGASAGERLRPVPTIETDWGPWLADNPGTVAYEMKPTFKPLSIPTAVGDESRSTRPARVDDRLGPDDRVFGVDLGDRQVAFHLPSLADGGVHAGGAGGRDFVVLWDGRSRTAAAFEPRTEGDDPKPATLTRADAADGGPARWIDRESGSSWTIAGRCVDGPRQGEALRWLPGVMVKWYAWSASYPESAVLPTP